MVVGRDSRRRGNVSAPRAGFACRGPTKPSSTDREGAHRPRGLERLPGQPRHHTRPGEVDVTRSAQQVGTLGHDAALPDLFTVGRAFLTGVAEDHKPSRMTTIAGRLGVDANDTSQHRLRLLEADLVTRRVRARHRFTALLRECLRGQLDSSRLAPTRPPGPPTPVRLRPAQTVVRTPAAVQVTPR